MCRHTPTNNNENIHEHVLTIPERPLVSNDHELMRRGKTCDVQFAKETMRGMNSPSYDNVAHNIGNDVELS